MAHALKIALIADIHHGMDVGTKVGSAALTLLQPFVDWVNAIGPDIVVDFVPSHAGDFVFALSGQHQHADDTGESSTVIRLRRFGGVEG